MRSSVMAPVVPDATVPHMPDMTKLPLRERAAAKATWLLANGIQFQSNVAGIDRAWNKERKKRNQ